jgi:hypothetical protein
MIKRSRFRTFAARLLPGLDLAVVTMGRGARGAGHHRTVTVVEALEVRFQIVKRLSVARR